MWNNSSKRLPRISREKSWKKPESVKQKPNKNFEFFKVLKI